MLADANLKELEPYDIEGVRELAAMCGIQLSSEASSAEVQNNLFPVWGSEKAFIENAPKVAKALRLDGTTLPSQEALDAIRATETLDRWPLRNVYDDTLPIGSVLVVNRGAVANWMVRGVREGERCREYYDLQIAGRFLVASDRLCHQDSEVGNRFVREYHNRHGRYPTEAELLPTIVQDVTGQVRSIEAVAQNQFDQIRLLVEQRPAIAAGQIYISTNANATYVPLQVRRAIRELYGGFDVDGGQFWFSQDDFPLASTPEQAADPSRYQRPLTAFSGLVRLINELCLLQGR